MPDEYWEWKIARATGWTLEYIGALSVERLHEYLSIIDAEAKAEAERNRPKPKGRHAQ